MQTGVLVDVDSSGLDGNSPHGGRTADAPRPEPRERCESDDQYQHLHDVRPHDSLDAALQHTPPIPTTLGATNSTQRGR